MSTLTSTEPTQRERELGAIINAYNEVTDQLKQSHEQLGQEVGRLRDELARKNDELRRRERLAALGEMAAGVAHEIRNPLGGIQLYASLLERDLRDRPAEERLAGKIGACVKSLESIMADILDFGRPSDPSPTRVRLEKLVAETIELASQTIDRAGVKVEVSSDLSDVELMTDGALLQRALLNLLINAIQATASAKGSSDHGRVLIDAVDGLDDQVWIAVQDEGPGIPADQMDRIFNPFFTTRDSGTGLGLAIVHQITETLGGSVRVANREEGGAVFTLCLPRRSAEDRLPASGASAHGLEEQADLKRAG